MEIGITRSQRFTLFDIAREKGVSPRELVESVVDAAIKASQDRLSTRGMEALKPLLDAPDRTLKTKGLDGIAIEDSKVRAALKAAGLSPKTLMSIWAERGMILPCRARQTYTRTLIHEGKKMRMWVFGNGKPPEKTPEWLKIDVRPALAALSHMPMRTVAVAGAQCLAIDNKDMLVAVPNINDIKESLYKRHILIRSDEGRYRYPVTIKGVTHSMWVFDQARFLAIVGH